MLKIRVCERKRIRDSKVKRGTAVLTSSENDRIHISHPFRCWGGLPVVKGQGIESYQCFPFSRGGKAEAWCDVDDDHQPAPKVRRRISTISSIFIESPIVKEVEGELFGKLALQAAAANKAAEEAGAKEASGGLASEESIIRLATQAAQAAPLKASELNIWGLPSLSNDLPSDVPQPLLTSLNLDRWKEYFKQMHETQGYGITSAPNRRAKILPFKFKENDEILPEIHRMAEFCILLYNELTPNEKDYTFNGEVENVTVGSTCAYSLYFITFTACEFDDSSKKTTFLGQYIIYRADEGNQGPEYCMRKDVAESKWRRDEPCGLICCSRYRLYRGTSRIYNNYLRNCWKEVGPPFWAQGENGGRKEEHQGEEC